MAGAVDVAYLLDLAATTTEKEIQEMKDFVQMTLHLFASKDQVNVGVLTSQQPSMLDSMRLGDKATISTSLKNIQPSNEPRKFKDALEMVQDMFTSSTAQKILVLVLAKGISNNNIQPALQESVATTDIKTYIAPYGGDNKDIASFPDHVPYLDLFIRGVLGNSMLFCFCQYAFCFLKKFYDWVLVKCFLKR